MLALASILTLTLTLTIDPHQVCNTSTRVEYDVQRGQRKSFPGAYVLFLSLNGQASVEE
jgi:hypothetical protein